MAAAPLRLEQTRQGLTQRCSILRPLPQVQQSAKRSHSTEQAAPGFPGSFHFPALFHTTRSQQRCLPRSPSTTRMSS